MSGNCWLKCKVLCTFFSTRDFGRRKSNAMLEVILFRGEARAGVANEFDYPANEKHGFLLFFRQPKDLPPNFDGAKQTMEKLGWQEVQLSRASPVEMEGSVLSSAHPQAPFAYQQALISGFSSLVFPKPISEEVSLPLSSRYKTDNGLDAENVPSQENKESAFS